MLFHGHPEQLQPLSDLTGEHAGAQVHFDSTVGIHPTAAEEWVSMRTRARRVQGRGSKRPQSML